MVTLGLQGQSWFPYASVEENIHFTDVPRTEGAIGLSDLASNAGLRLGAYYSYNNLLSGEITLGVIGIGTPNVFSNTIVPVEIVGHYNIFNGNDVTTLSKFNIDFGVGTGLGEASDGYFGQSEHVVVGAFNASSKCLTDWYRNIRFTFHVFSETTTSITLQWKVPLEMPQ